MKQLKEGEKLLEKKHAQGAEGIRKTQSAIVRLDRISSSEMPVVMEWSLFLGLFGIFDAFTGNLLTALYRKKPELFRAISRSVPVSEILEHKSFDELQTSVLAEEIEDFRRKSYVDQFKELESTFTIKLREFERWPAFVEASQRRNLFTHCDAVVSDQYLKVCKREGYSFVTAPKIGERLELGGEYFLPVCDLVMEVGLMLGQTLWRKVLPNEIADADVQLNEAIYRALLEEEWKRAERFGRFATNQRNISSDVYRRMFLVNLAIAYKFADKKDDAKNLLSSVDWTTTSGDFRLAEAVLNDKFEDAAKLMKKIGKEGDFVKETSYHVWPLFRQFRASQPFLSSYEAVYGRPFKVELKKTAEEAQERSVKEVKSLKKVTRPNMGRVPKRK